MKVLVVTPVQRLANGKPLFFPRAMESIYDLHYSGQVDYFTPTGNDLYEANENVGRKYAVSRDFLLAQDYDAMLTIESDMIVPPDALERLAGIEADVIYGLYVLRHGKKQWNAYTEVKVREGKSLVENPEKARSLYGQVVEVAGISFGCTLIHRRVLEAVPFRWRTHTHTDWIFAMDVAYAGGLQVSHLGVHCGHITGDKVLWPSIDTPELYIETSL